MSGGMNEIQNILNALRTKMSYLKGELFIFQ